MTSKPRYTGSITYAKNEQPPVARGAILIAGSSPHAKVTVLDFDGGKTGQQIDVLRDVKIEEDEKSGRLTLQGQSLFAIRHVDASDGNVTLRVDVKRCKDCPG